MFTGVTGHEPVKKLFAEVIRQNKLAHSYIFTGPDGIGKFIFAQELAKALLCENKTGCNKCASCRKFDNGNHTSVRIVNIPSGKKHIPIDIVREIESEIMLKPFEGRHKIFIINNAEMFTDEAANAFLKTLEEPPAYSLIILIVSNIAAMLPTVISRSQVVRFYPIPDKVLEKILKDKIKLSEPEMKLLVTLSDGSAGKAMMLSESKLIAHRDKLLEGLFQPKKDLADEIIRSGDKFKDNESIRSHIAQQFKLISLFLMDVLLFKLNGGKVDKLLNRDKEQLLIKAEAMYSEEALEKAIDNLVQAEEYLRMNLNPKIVVSNAVFSL